MAPTVSFLHSPFPLTPPQIWVFIECKTLLAHPVYGVILWDLFYRKTLWETFWMHDLWEEWFYLGLLDEICHSFSLSSTYFSGIFRSSLIHLRQSTYGLSCQHLCQISSLAVSPLRHSLGPLFGYVPPFLNLIFWSNISLTILPSFPPPFALKILSFSKS